jgi:hypothetical protein
VDLPHSPSLAEFVLSLGATPVQYEIYVQPPGAARTIHRDIGAGMFYLWSVNCPLLGWQHSCTQFWHTQGPGQMIGKVWCWHRERATLLGEYPTESVFAMNTWQPHSVINRGTEDRVNLLIRMPKEWRP